MKIEKDVKFIASTNEKEACATVHRLLINVDDCDYEDIGKTLGYDTDEIELAFDVITDLLAVIL